MVQMETRIAGLADLDVLWPLVAAFRDLVGQGHPEVSDNSVLRGNIQRVLTTGEAEFFLASDNTGKGVGYIQQRYYYSLWLYGLGATWEDLYVSPESRKGGIGTHLAQLAIERAKQKGCRSISLDTNENNHEAMPLYQRLGFKSGSTRYVGSRQLFFQRILA